MILRKIRKFIHFSVYKNHFQTPPILIFFVTSACNSRCYHCFYKNNLNQQKDLSLAEIEKISRSMGKIYQLELSGGEPFLRKDLPRICELFYKNNHLEELQIPTNSLLAGKIDSIIEEILARCPGVELNINLSLDGTEKMHDSIRGVKGNFQLVLKNYQNLCLLKKKHQNLFLNLTSTVSKKNINDLFELIDWSVKKMPLVDHHYLGYLRGRTYQEKIDLPPLEKLKRLNSKIIKLYGNKNGFFYNYFIQKINQTKLKVLVEKRQVVPCLAGRLVGVIYENGEVANCEMLASTGKSWQSLERIKQRKETIEKKICYCTHECFLGPSVIYGLPS